MKIARHAAKLVPGKVRETQVPPGTADHWATQTQGGEPVWRGEPPATGAEILFSGEMVITGFSRDRRASSILKLTMNCSTKRIEMK
jgi:hypothetical protein